MFERIIEQIKLIILKYPNSIPVIKRFFRIIQLREKDRLYNLIRKDKQNFQSWVNKTIKLHKAYSINSREYIYSNNNLFFKSKYGVFFKYINNFGLRNLEFSDTNDRLQLEFILNNISDDATIFDIGASYGYYCLTIAKVKGNSICHAFEPSKKSINAMYDNKKINKLNNITINNCSVGLNDGYGKIRGKKNKFGVQYVEPTNLAINSDFEMKSIDKYVKDKNIANINFIKMDIEGAELTALNGGKESIVSFRPIVQCELSNNFSIHRYNYDIKEVYNFFNKLNYTYAFINKDRALYEYGGLEKSSGNFSIDSLNSSEFFFIPNEIQNKINYSTNFKNKINKPYAT